MTKIAIIGGTGLENPELLDAQREIIPETPFGKTDSGFLTGQINGTEVVLVSRHGKDHSIPPTQVNNRANIWAIQELGCTGILATTACGSLREEIGRGDLVFPDQFIDFTRHRQITFYDHFEQGSLKHTPMADPFSGILREVLIKTARKLQLNYHEKGTVLTIEGPRFSTRAESKMFRTWGADLINMSIAPEVILANESGIPYACIAISTDYDSWKAGEDPVSWEEVLKVFDRNVHRVIELIVKSLPLIK